jgi:UDP-N-acetylmuramate--alanine ligase
MLLDKITAPNKSIQTKEEVLKNAQNDADFDVLATVGAGDIDTLVPQLKQLLAAK